MAHALRPIPSRLATRPGPFDADAGEADAGAPAASGPAEYQARPGFQSVAGPARDLSALRQRLCRRLERQKISLRLGGRDWPAGALGDMSHAQYLRLCRDHGLDGHDLLELLDDLNRPANQGRTFEVDRGRGLAAEQHAADGFEHTYGPLAAGPLGPAPDLSPLPAPVADAARAVALACNHEPETVKLLLAVTAAAPFRALVPAEQVAWLRLLGQAVGDRQRLEALQDILCAPALSQLDARARDELHARASAGIEDPDCLRRLAAGLSTRLALTAADLGAASRALLISSEVRREVLEQLDARRISFSCNAGERRTYLSASGAHQPDQGLLSLQALLGADDPAQAIARALPGLDPLDLGAVLLGLVRSDARDVTIDLSPGGPLAHALALADGLDGNLAAALAAEDLAPHVMLANAQRLDDLDLGFRYLFRGQLFELSGPALLEVLSDDDPQAAFAASFPGLQLEPFGRFLADVLTLPPQRLAGYWIDLSRSGDFRLSGLFGTQGYHPLRAERALRNLFFDESLTFARAPLVAGLPLNSPALADHRLTRALREKPVMVASVGKGEVSWSEGMGYYTKHLLALLGEHGKLGAALEASRTFAAEDDQDVNQLATVTGDPRVLDQIAPAQRRALLINCSRFVDSNPLPGTGRDVSALRRELINAGQLSPEAITTLANPSAVQALAAMESAVDAARPGQALVIYVSSHGLPSGLVFSDDNEIGNRQIGELYARAEDRGLRLVLVADTCHSGAQADAVRQSEIKRLEQSGHAHPLLAQANALHTYLAAISIAVLDLNDAKSQVPPALRLFGAEKDLAGGIAAALAPRSVGGQLVPGPALLERLRAHHSGGPRLQALQAEVRVIKDKLAAFEANRVDNPRPTAREYAILGYEQALHALSRAVTGAARMRCRLLAAGELTPALRELLDRPELSGQDARVTPRELARLVDQADEAVADLLRRSTRIASPAVEQRGDPAQAGDLPARRSGQRRGRR